MNTQKAYVRDYWCYRGNRLFVVCASTIICVFIFFLSLLTVHSIQNGRAWNEYDTTYKTYSKVGASSVTLGTTKRNRPVAEVKNEGSLSNYPVYGKSLGLDTDQKNALIAENVKLCCRETFHNSGSKTASYDWLDADGSLYNGTRANPTALNRKLYKHTGASNMYYGDVADDEAGVIKQLTFSQRTYTNYYEVTGLYAPAGEVIKVELSDEAMQATGGLTFHIGQALYNGQANNIWAARGFNRMPIILNTMSITKNTAVYNEQTKTWTGYIGSFVGGPIYVRWKAKTYTVTISGAVNYQHFILGKTTPEEYAENAKSSAPYFDLEIWSTGVLLSGPKNYAKSMTYDQMYEVASLWDKISLVTTKVSNHGVVFLFDPFVAAGAAVAFPGRWSVNCPVGWFREALNYQSFVTSGTWGNLHEFHHNYQNYGVGYTGEVTNNALNLVTYSLFTNISAARQIGNYGGSGLSGWNSYTSATWALNRVNNGVITSTNGLAVYATLLHNFGQDAFIKTKGKSGNNYFNQWASVTHQDFSYYATKMISAYAPDLKPADTDYPLFVPVSCVYQTGRSYNYDGERRYIETMQPYTIPYGQDFTIDLNPYSTNTSGQYTGGSIVIAKDFTYRVKKLYAVGLNGTLRQTDENIYRFTPNAALRSGKIHVTLEITTKDGQDTYNGKTLDDVDLVLELQQTHETKKNVLERTTYTFDQDITNGDARDFYNTKYAGAVSATTDNKNSTQNSNTDIWLTANEINNKQVMEVRGKLYFPENGKYRIYLRGRGSCALYISTDNQTYKLGAYVNKDVNKTSPNFTPNNASSYTDITAAANTWLYFKEVMVVPRATDGSGNSFIGLGIKQWTTPTYTVEEIKDEQDKVIGYRYRNQAGVEVPRDEAENAQPIEPTGTPNYATAYRLSYEFPKRFTAPYFYKPEYTYKIGESEFEFKQITPDLDTLQYIGHWQYTPTTATFGHVYVGKRGAEIRCSFTGTQLGVLMSSRFGTDLQIYVDGQCRPLTKTVINDNTIAITTPVLKDRRHDVIIRCVGTGNVDSLLVR